MMWPGRQHNMLLVIDLTVLNVLSSFLGYEERSQMILSCIGTWDVRWHWGCYKKVLAFCAHQRDSHPREYLYSQRFHVTSSIDSSDTSSGRSSRLLTPQSLHSLVTHFRLWWLWPSGFIQRVRLTNSVRVEGTTASVAFLRHTAFLNFIQSLKTICVSTCFLHRQDLPSFSLADRTKNGFKLSNFRFILTSGYCA